MDDQLALISPDPPICETLLQTDSPKCAFYKVSVFRLAGHGYIIRKESGRTKANGELAKPAVTTYFEPVLRDALELQIRLAAKKTGKKDGRIYLEVKDWGHCGKSQ